ncbi:MAG: hypothetical protein OXU81_21860 [Gammaproteobacteria bacterium]|nr:hypothetical protein [Gammaproteobacteria bacterium]
MTYQQSGGVPAETGRPRAVMSVYDSDATFEAAQRRAKSLAASTLVPPQFQGNMPNCLIALELAGRLEMSPFMVLQNVDVIHGRPFLRAQFVGAIINASRRFKKPLMFSFEGEKGTMERTCIAWTIDRDGDKIEGMPVSMQLAKDEGWIDRKGSKWKTMPELMLRYRATTFFGRLNCPDLLMGFQDEHEVIDITPAEYTVVNERAEPRSGLAARLAAAREAEETPEIGTQDEEPAGEAAEAELEEQQQEREPVTVDQETGEVVETQEEAPAEPLADRPPLTADEIGTMIAEAKNLDDIAQARDLLRELPRSMREELGTRADQREVALKGGEEAAE